jgi:hypothetical protein
MLLLPVSSCHCSSTWTSWARKAAIEQHCNTTNFYWRSTSTILLLAFFASTSTLFQANNTTFFLILFSTSAITLA